MEIDESNNGMGNKKVKLVLILSVPILLIIIISFIIPKQREEKGSLHIEIPPQKDGRYIRLYFSSPERKGLIPRLIYMEEKENVLDEAKFVLNRLIEGPKEEGLVPTIPPGVRIRELYIAKGVAYPDFSREFIENHWGGTTGEIHTVYSVVNALTLNFDEIEKVQFLVEGKGIQTLCGHLDLSRPIGPDLELILEKKGGKEEKEREDS